MLEVAEEQQMFSLFLLFFSLHYARTLQKVHGGTVYIHLLNSIPHGNINLKCVYRKGRQSLFLCHITSKM